MTDTEKKLWRHLRMRQIAGCRFRRQLPLEGYIADFACVEKKLVVEVDGGQHAENAPYDAQRDRVFGQLGYRVLRFWNNEVLGEIEAVKTVIARALGSLPPSEPSPLKGEGILLIMSSIPCSLAAVLDRPDVWRGDALGRGGVPGISSGFAALDAELPGGGWPVGALTEIFPSHEGIGELRLLGPALARGGERLAWIAPPYLPYAPALAAAGIDPAKLVIVRAASAKDALWAAEQALRSNACGAVLAWLGSVKYADLRRLQIAAEGGRAPAFLFRSGDAVGESSPAALRIALETHRGGLALRLLKRRGAPLASPILLPPMPPAGRTHSSDHHVDRRSISAPAARDLPARLVRA